ncbi:MAG: hypothetical protein QE278_06560 [Limnobacter sp.]|nr:hypothetical protein [Limnobacter sp.]
MKAYFSKSFSNSVAAYFQQRKQQRLHNNMRKRLSRLVSYGLS